MKSATSLAVAATFLSGSADAFWRMPCFGRTTLARLDPIVDPGIASTHSHTVHGGGNFGETTTYDMLRASECTSCQFDDDKSAYWTPSMHFVHENGEVEVVPQVGGMLAYYMLLGKDIKAFPKGFQMLAGDPRLRNFTGPVPDPPTSSWTKADMAQSALGQKSLGFNCLNYGKAPEGSRYRHFLPDKDYLDQNCANGVRAELFFPSCWNGKDVTAADHKSHMAYPTLIDGGDCPPGFDTRLPSLFYETIWNTYAFKGQPGQFVWSHGDPTGYGYHGDFMNGWNIDVLQNAVNDCTDESGRTEDCKHFVDSLQTESKQAQCKVKDSPKILSADNCAGPAKGLCGNVPIQYGPGYAKALKAGDAGTKPVVPVISSAAPVPVQSYAPAQSQGAGGVSVYKAPQDAAAPSVAALSVAAPPSVAAVAAAVTPAPAGPPAAPAPGKNIVGTTTFTSAGKVYEVAIEEVVVTVTVTDNSDAAKHKHRRHVHHRRQREHGLLG